METCRHNLQTSLLAQIGVAESRTWKQLVQQGEQAEEIVARVRAEENKPRPKKSTRRARSIFSIKEEGNPENRGIHSKRMSQLEQRLEALTNRKGLLEAGVVRPYPVEWDFVPYPPKFKTLTLQAFDGKGSLNQHIY